MSRTYPNPDLPPFKSFPICDIRPDKAKAFIKAKSVCDHIFQVAKDGGKLPRGRALGTCARAELDVICAYSVGVITKNHDKWLLEESKKPPKRLKTGGVGARKAYKPCKPRKATALSFLTIHNYLHRRDSHIFEEQNVNDGDSD